MSGKAVDAGKTFLAGVLAKISDPEKRAQVEAAFNDPSATDALVTIGSGALAQSDINRKYDDLAVRESTLAEDYTKLQTWYTEKQAALAEYDQLKANPALRPVQAPPAAPAIDPAQFLSREDFATSMHEQQRSAANYLALQNTLTLNHFRDFNEVLDAQELLTDRNLGKALPDGRIYGLVDAYRTKYSEKITAKEQAAESARIQKLVDEKVAERMRATPGLPMPVRGGGSPLDALEAEPGTAQYTAEAAAIEYDRLQQSRQSA